MAEKMPQTFANHMRLDPPYHFFVAPVAAISVLVAIWNTIQHFDFISMWLIVVSLAVFVAVFKARAYALKAQDRVIRLEERLRLTTLLPEAQRSKIGELSESQLIALRFACDAELPGLFEKTLSGKLPAAEIKKAIVNWRPDYFRI
jgi:hypothetical protein